MPNIEPICVSINEAARLLGVSRSSVYRLINEGALPATKVRSRTLIHVERLRSVGGAA